MTISFGDVNFDGHKGTIQLVKPKLEHYTRFGDNRVYVQKINDSANISNIELWSEFTSRNNAVSHIQKFLSYVGMRKRFEDSHGIGYVNAIPLDITYTMERKAGGKWLVQYDVQITVDKGDTNSQAEAITPEE